MQHQQRMLQQKATPKPEFNNKYDRQKWREQEKEKQKELQRKQKLEEANRKIFEQQQNPNNPKAAPSYQQIVNTGLNINRN